MGLLAAPLLDDLEALNEALNFTAGAADRGLVPFAPVHIQMMELGPFDRAYFDHLDGWLEMIDSMAQLGYAFTGVDSGRPMCSFGIYGLWPGVAEMWLVPDANLGRLTVSFHRATGKFLDICMEELRLVRLQVTVNISNIRADKWIRRLYFTEEGILRRFGPEGGDYKMYARVKQNVAQD